MKFLGMPLRLECMRREDWTGLIENFNKRLGDWKGKVLSTGEVQPTEFGFVWYSLVTFVILSSPVMVKGKKIIEFIEDFFGKVQY